MLVIVTACNTVVQAQTPTISSLTVTHEADATIKWYDALTGGTLYASPGTTSLVSGQIYYASQTLNGVESASRFAVTATLVTQTAPAAADHTPAQTQVVWNWNSASGATGYKWGTTNVYADATNMLTARTNTETGLTCNTSYSRYVWAYNASGCVSAVTALTQTTSSCGDAVYTALSGSRASYTAAAANDLVKITAAEYASVKTALSATAIGYTGAFTNDWATSATSGSTTFSYNANSNENTIQTYSALNYPVAFTFHPGLNPQGAYTCQLKYNNGGTLVNVSSVFSGATAAVTDRQYFVIKTPTQLPNATPYIAVYSSGGIATINATGSHYWSWVEGNQTGAKTLESVTGGSSQLPSPQVLQTSTKQW